MSAAIGVAALGLLGGLAVAQEPEDKPADRILGGWTASMADHPWQVAIIKTELGSRWANQFCGGSVIAERWVLTAAHCMYWSEGEGAEKVYHPRTPGQIVVAWGEADLDVNGPTAAVSRIIVHEGYDHRTSVNDIALLELDVATPIPAQPVTLATPAAAAGLEWTGISATVAGWGNYQPVVVDKVTGEITDLLTREPVAAERMFEHQYPTLLQAVNVPVADLETCRAAYPGILAGIDERLVCAGAINEGVDACEGDSGGPLVVTAPDGARVQIGVVSWGRHCEQQAGGEITDGYYNFYTRVSAFADWIAEKSGVGAGAPAEEEVYESPFDSVFRPSDAPAIPAAFLEFEPFNTLSLAAGSVDAAPSTLINAGGAENASALGPDCVGHIAQRADVSVRYAGGGRPLHISVASEKDTTLAVLTPDGRVVCGDDIDPGVNKNPHVEIAAPASGEYRIWIGTYYEESPYPPSRLYFSEAGPKFAD